MDLRVYVDGVARIICDLTRTTTVHNIIIALAQYKGKAGRYSLIQRAPDGTQKTLSPHQLTCELIHHSDWAYILQQNPSNKQTSYGQKRSQSLDDRKTPPLQQHTVAEKFLPLTSSTDHIRTVENNKISHGFITLSSPKKKRSNAHQTLSSINTNNNNNNNNNNTSSHDSPVSQKHLSRTSVPNSYENQFSPRYSRSRSTVPTENSAFHIIHNPNLQQYTALVQLLKKQELQVEQQTKDLTDKQNEIDYRETILCQTQLYQDSIQHEFKLLEEHDRRLFSECQTYAQEYSTEKFDQEFEYHQQLNTNYEHLEQQLAHCSAILEQKKQLQEQLQIHIEQTHGEIQQIQTNINNDKKEIIQYEYDLERSNSSLKQQEELGYVLSQRSEDIELFIQQHQKQILELEIELIRLDNLLLNDILNQSYHFQPTPSADVLTPVEFQFMNSTLLKLCPSGIWV